MSRLSWIPLFLFLLSGCASLIGSATSRMADDISLAIMNQDDPATVRDGAPAYLLMIDGLIEGDPKNTGLLLSGARLYGSYAGAFAEDEARARRLSQKALHYARRALCQRDPALCAASEDRLERFTESLAKADTSGLAAIYGFGVAWATPPGIHILSRRCSAVATASCCRLTRPNRLRKRLQRKRRTRRVRVSCRLPSVSSLSS